MKTNRATLETCAKAQGTVVVIDVLRAFSCAAYAFGAGAKEIVLVASVEEAFSLKNEISDVLLMGEVGGQQVEGFDFSNSPQEISAASLEGRRLVQRTSAGTQGVVRSTQAQTLLASSFCCAEASAAYIQELPSEEVTFVITGIHSGLNGDEDAACADYIESLLHGESPDPAPYLQRIRSSTVGQRFGDPDRPYLPLADLEYCSDLNRFPFAMLVKRLSGRLMLTPVRSSYSLLR